MKRYKSAEYDSGSEDEYNNGYYNRNRYGEGARMLKARRSKRTPPRKPARAQEKPNYEKPEILTKIIEAEAKNRRAATYKKNQFANSVFFNMVA